MWEFIGLLSMFAIVIFMFMAALSFFKKSGKVKKYLFYAAGCFVLLIAALSIDISDDKETASTKVASEVQNEGNAVKEEKTEEEKAVAEAEAKKKAEEEARKQEEAEAKRKAEEEAAKTPQQKMFEQIMGLIDAKQAFDSGSYIKGDLPPGEYAFISFDGSGKYYAEKDTAGNIIDNENFDSFGYVHVHDVGNIETGGVLISTGAFGTLGVSSAKEIYQVLNNVEDYKQSALYKVGTDIPAGQYVIESYGNGYVAKMSGPVGKSDIIDNENFNGRFMVNVTNGQYLQISNGTIAQ
ncbi:hypothetical protein [Bacillus sp. T33-2]|uniref:hypothetical protein n=1 Tax=Bacillus sp. T33-2 TaxID=2054168 RepID=UPI000C775D86|nr:hypothetical protein [Bacillus sp. T33-2]PLR89518.1 hypothetical protein CVD19_23595 [Bacillus sp. T33-2]